METKQRFEMPETKAEPDIDKAVCPSEGPVPESQPLNSVNFPVNAAAKFVKSYYMTRFPVSHRTMFSAQMMISSDEPTAQKLVDTNKTLAPELAQKGFTAICTGSIDNLNPDDNVPPILGRVADHLIGHAYGMEYLPSYKDRLLDKIRNRNPDWKCGDPTGVVAVLFTGGMDSTALVIKNLEEGKIVIPVYNWLNHCAESYRLLAATVYLAFRNKCKVNTENLMPLLRGMRFPCTVTRRECFSGFIQQPLNAFSLAYIPEEITALLDEVQMGIVKGDQSVSFVDDMRKLYEGAFALSHMFGDYHDPDYRNPFIKRRPDFNFPLLDWDKKRIEEYLVRTGMDGITLSCEVPFLSFIVFARLTDEEKAALDRGEIPDFDHKRDVGVHIIMADCTKCHSCGRSEADGRSRRYLVLQLMEYKGNPEVNPIVNYWSIANGVKPEGFRFDGKIY